MFIDLKRAFDTVNPNRKLKQLGLSENAVKVMLAYFVQRKTATTVAMKRNTLWCKRRISLIYEN